MPKYEWKIATIDNREIPALERRLFRCYSYIFYYQSVDSNSTCAHCKVTQKRMNEIKKNIIVATVNTKLCDHRDRQQQN